MCIRDRYYDGSSGRDGDEVDDEENLNYEDERVDEIEDENEIGDEGGDEIGEELGEDGSEEQREDGEKVQCHEVDLDYGDEKGEIAEEEEKAEVEEREAGLSLIHILCLVAPLGRVFVFGKFERLNCRGAVSYTHLDVYKRQGLADS